MGLDMSLYRVSHPYGLKDGDVLTAQQKYDFQDKNVNFLQIDPSATTCKTIKNNATRVFCLNSYFDITMIAIALCEKYGIPYTQEKEDELNLDDRDENHYIFSYNEYKLDIPAEEIESYVIQKKEEYYAYHVEEVAYQRKGLNDFGWECLGVIGNTNYSDDYDLIMKMIEEGGLSENFKTEWVFGETVFWPWW